LDRIHQARDVALERKEEAVQLQVDLVERQTSALMQAVYAAAGNRAGVEMAAGWQMYPDVAKQAEANLPATRKVAGMFGGPARPEFDWAEIEAAAAALKEAS
jgi:hypothetical protein